MPAYLIARVNVTDPAKYENYKALAPAAIAQYGGKYLARGGATETLEGEAESRRVVILEFPDMEAARTFYNSPEYTAAKAERAGAGDGQFIIVEGTASDPDPPSVAGASKATRGEEQRSCDRETKEQQEARSSAVAAGSRKSQRQPVNGRAHGRCGQKREKRFSCSRSCWRNRAPSRHCRPAARQRTCSPGRP
jgi:uncharacterized protein (DUF1330 family)